MSQFSFHLTEKEFDALTSENLLIPVSAKNGKPLISSKLFTGRDYYNNKDYCFVVDVNPYFSENPSDIYNKDVPFVERWNNLITQVSKLLEYDHYLIKASFPALKPRPFKKEKATLIKKQMLVKEHPHYLVLREIADKIQDTYKVEAKVDKTVRSHYFFRGVYDLAIKIGVQNNELPILFMVPLSGIKAPEKETVFGVFTDDKRSVEEVFASLEGKNLKEVTFKSQEELGLQKFDSLFPMNDGAFEAPIEQSVKVAFAK